MLNDVPWHPKVVGTEFLSIHLLPTYCSFNKYLFDICNWNFAREGELEVNQTVIVLDRDLQSSEKDFFLKEVKQENLSGRLNSTIQDKRIYQWKIEEQKRHNTYRRQRTK